MDHIELVPDAPKTGNLDNNSPMDPMTAIFLTGPTGSGKSAIAVELAERVGAEIVSMDSMAVYRGMDIGTAKPSAADRTRVPHHMIDIVEPWQEFSLADYLVQAEAAARSIGQRGRRALFVGGTPLYLKALLHGAESGPPPDAELRTRLAKEAAAVGVVALHERLAAVDPDAARRIHPNDVRRTIRAIEVFERTGRPISASQVHFIGPPNRDANVFCVDLPRAELYRRINERVAAMFQAGFVDEVRGLTALDRPLSHTARQAVGYKEVIELLNNARPLAETIELVQRRTRQFAKRQITWFRGMPECQPVENHSVIGRVLSTMNRL
jgi:tRNA dimethylallyltransferase